MQRRRLSIWHCHTQSRNYKVMSASLLVYDRKLESIGSKVLELIILDAQTMPVVEDEGFHRLMEYSEPRYSLPSRKYFSETGIQLIINSAIVLGIDRYTKPRHRYRD